jgi:hypothetical protein
MRLAALLLIAAPLPAQPLHERCSACHSEQAADFQTHTHFNKSLSCDICHGRSEKHMKAVGAAPPDRVAAPDEVPALCGPCHAGQHKDYLPTAHAKLVLARSEKRAPNCSSCHGHHAPRAAKSMCGRCHARLPDPAPGHGNR